MKRLAIIGAGDLGLQLGNLAAATGAFSLAGYFDDTKPVGSAVAGATVLGPLAGIESAYQQEQFDCLVVGIGYKHLDARQRVFEQLRHTIPFAVLVHPSVIMDPTCRLGAGAVIYPGCVLDWQSVIGENVLLNAGCVVAHHSEVGAGSFLSPAVSLAGFVRVEPGCVLGIGTVVIDGIRIASGARTGAGAVVTRDLDQPGLYLGVPARFSKGPPAP